jgi:tetratricopeptide (TPR) repeat protein
MDSAERVCAGDAVPDFEVLDLLTHLVDASLVAFDSHGSSPRYRLLETVRQYAMDRLLEAAEADTFRRRHAEEFEQMMREAETGLLGPDADAWADRCRSEVDNVRAALTWATEADEHELALQIAGPLGRYWSYAGLVAEARDRLSIIALHDHEDSVPLSEALGWLSHFLHLEGKTEEAAALADRALEVARRVGDQRALLRALMVKANVLSSQGKPDAALESYLEIAERARNLGDDYLQIALFNIAMAAPGRNRDDESRRAAAEMIELAESSGQGIAIAMARSVAAVSAFFRGDLDEAREHAAIGEHHLVPGFPQPIAGIAITSASLALIEGDLGEAETQARRCLAATEQVGQTDLMILGNRILAEIALRRGEIDPALDHFETAVETLFGRTDRPDDAAFLGSTLAAIALRLDELELAMTAAELDRLWQIEQDIRLPVPFALAVKQVYAEIVAAIPPEGAEAAAARAARLQGREIVTLLAELRAAR